MNVLNVFILGQMSDVLGGLSDPQRDVSDAGEDGRPDEVTAPAAPRDQTEQEVHPVLLAQQGGASISLGGG